MIFSNLVLNMRSNYCFYCFKNFILRMKSSTRQRSFCVLNASRMTERSIQHPPNLLKMYINGAQSLNPSSCRLFHTVKGWKFIVKPELAENDGDDAELDAADAPCEEGTGAMPHNQLLSQLNECSTIQDQINALNSALGLKSEDIANRKAFQKSIAEVLVPYFSDFEVHQFGSGMNGFGFKGCDIDLCIQTTFDNTAGEEYLRIDVPTLEDVLEGKVLKSDVIRQHPKMLLRFIRRIFRKHCSDIRLPIFLIKARCPILRFYDQKHDLFCDFSCENKFALKNTKLLRLLSHMDIRIDLLGKVLRYWGKHGKFVGDIEMFNSYAFTLMIIYFLQNTTPAVLPPIDILTKTDYVLHGAMEDDELMHKTLKMIPPTKNTQTTEELLREFFFFYLYYDFGRVMLPLTSYSVNKQDFKSDENSPTDSFDLSTICLQDPFRHSFNATSGVSYRCCRNFLANIVDACKLYENPNMWLQNQENWGLSSIFASATFEVGKEKLVEVSKIETFEVPIKPTALHLSETCEDTISATERYHQNIAKCLKDILEYCLLFKCNSLFLPHKSKNQGQILKLHCKVTHNTWVGRHLAQREHFSNSSVDNPLELEHQISTYLAKEKKSDEVLFKSVCNCYVTEKDGHTVLKLCFILEAGKMSPIAKIFFQEHISKMLNNLL